MRAPRRVEQPDRQRERERPEMTRHVRGRALDLAEHQWPETLRGDHDRDPGQGRTQPTATAETRWASPVDHPLGHVGHRLDPAEASVSGERGHTVGVVPASGTVGQVRFEQRLLVTRHLVIGRRRHQLADLVARSEVVGRRSFHERDGRPCVSRSSRRDTGEVDPLTRLLLDARDGDRDALERFIALTQADVWRLCRHLGDPDSADDLAQETYERAIGSLHRYRAEGPGRHWILTIARRTCADGTRRRSRRRRLDARVARQRSVETSTTERVELDDLVARLDPDRREAFVLTQVLGLQYAEAAGLIGCPVGTIRSRVARARADLLEMFDPSESRHDGTDPIDGPGELRRAGGRP